MVDPIELADPRQVAPFRDWLQRTYPLYLGELSEYDDSKYHLTADGHWEPDYLPYWLEQPFCLPLVAVAENVPVGFAFVGQPPFPFMSASCDFRLCEFFVLRELRRSGLGRRIAVALLSSKVGAWELVVLPRNTAAAAFWRVVLPLVSTAQPAETRSESELHFAFSTRASSRPTVRP
jgi:predicted acetyltransferase